MSFANIFVIYFADIFFCTSVYFMKALKSGYLTVYRSYDFNVKSFYKILLFRDGIRYLSNLLP